MKFAVLMVAAGLVLSTLGACTPQSPPPSGRPQSTVCTGQRPQMCTREYRPVCGTDVRGASRSFGNACEACADKQVVSHRPGTC
ncbi:MAG: hypothetical protein KF889_16740 [Alphaproteobacteria bacterium]|nr:hypothetical protein [Alphaproteobacteria bacterium]MCW5739983.1 hypothetical protein [Alphaproteobacteria bacterium]